MGDTTTVLLQTGPEQVRVVGTARFGTADSVGGATMAVFAPETAQRVREAAGRAGRPVAILQDLPGPKLRIGALKDDTAELAVGEGPARVYRVEPLGTIEDDPNVTDKRFPGNPTRSYRTTEPLRVIEEVTDWDPPPAAMIQHMRERMAELAELGIEAMDD